jgi:hypothetical protein
MLCSQLNSTVGDGVEKFPFKRTREEDLALLVGCGIVLGVASAIMALILIGTGYLVQAVVNKLRRAAQE